MISLHESCVFSDDHCQIKWSWSCKVCCMTCKADGAAAAGARTRLTPGVRSVATRHVGLLVRTLGGVLVFFFTQDKTTSCHA